MLADEFMVRIPNRELVERIALAEIRSQEAADAAKRAELARRR